MPQKVQPPAPFALAATAAVATAFAYCAVLGNFLFRGLWIRDAAGHPIVTDFLPVYVAGLLARQGHATTAYDWRHLHAVEAGFAGHDFSGYISWHYPPLFFLAAIPLSFVGYLPAFLAWTCATLLGFGATVAVIARRPMAGVMALALPPVLACALVGQNGFFTALLLGVILLNLPRRPLLAGVALAAFTFKPQFGFLIPFALIAGGYYRTLFTASVLVLAGAIFAVWLVPDSVIGFLHGLPVASRAVLTDGAVGWTKLQSVYGAARLLGAGDALGWSIQIVTALAAGGGCVALWRRREISFNLKAAMLAIATLLATPYIFFYDLPLLALPLAFMFCDRPFDRVERLGIAAAFGLLASVLILPMPMGLAAILLVAALVARRTRGFSIQNDNAAHCQNSASSSSTASGSALAASIHSSMSGRLRMVSQ